MQNVSVSRGHAAPVELAEHSLRWRVQEIDYASIDHDQVRDDENLFYLLVGASFIETGSDTYTRNLVAHYAGYPEVAEWLAHHWEPEELQHGAALKRYVQTVWPAFDWEPAYANFFEEYGRLCQVEELQPDRRLEMVARCVVETGTTAYYQTLGELAREPVLRDLLERIRTDEVQHYKHFLGYFRQLHGEHPVSRASIARVLYARLQELRDSDSDVALRHVWAFRGRMFPEGACDFDEISKRMYRLVSTRLPADQAIRMLLKPMSLPHHLERIVQKPLSKLALRVMGP
ncbi:ferritin-like domain-containing protein [Ottowia sp. VDI28]|uniref:ferritin-like domain-containing protein n=1 Tax=Ottowia sp. VDI28 TaxID=3133968 RepID=UPI003C2AF7CB